MDPCCYDVWRRTYKRGGRMAETDCWRSAGGVRHGGERPPYSSGSVLCSAQTYSTVQGWSSIKCIRQMGPSRETCRCPNQKWPYIKGLSLSSSLFPPPSSSLFLSLSLSHKLTLSQHTHTSAPTPWLLPVRLLLRQ